MAPSIAPILKSARGVGALDNPHRQKEAPPRRNYIPPGRHGTKKTRGVFSIIRGWGSSGKIYLGGGVILFM